ncbi:ribose ABC transporter permease [Planotetraspora silvatica]|uniref:Ribose ABC transporter permease n=1 Tax=Planotetraspora silvatica TaxID=234614 RepID=A0A8J3XS21_9ACTN|nr:ABC transporter permease [Planotetraspora silvatica]GII50750.1 ribose ABC transporter permease [Planotetraspora silvatica]
MPESVRGEGAVKAPSAAPPTRSIKPASWLRDTARRPGWLGDLSMLPALVVLIAVLSVLTEGVLTPSNIINVCSQSAVVAIAAIGATFVILTGGIDLSTGSVIGAGGVTAAWVITSTGSVLAGAAAGILAGTAIGLVVGTVAAKLPVVPFAVTLAALYVVSGATTLLSHGKTIAPVPAGFIEFSIDGPGGVPYSVWLAVVLYAVAQTVLTRTAWGRRVLHVGANVEVARISGVHVARTKASVYAVAGLFSAIAGIVLTSGLAGASASMGGPLLLNIVGAVVLGGTSLFGGRGSLLRTAVGVLFLGFVSNGMSLLGLASFDQQIITGAVIFIAASVDGIGRWSRRRS